MLIYEIGISGQRLRFTQEVLEHFDRFRQRSRWNREAGGHLFVRVDDDLIEVVHASGPERGDLRKRFFFGFGKRNAQRIIDERFKAGEHYIGDWHTHPQDIPRPSDVDYSTMASRFKRSDHGLCSMVFCIVGRAKFPDGIVVLIHNGHDCLTLEAT